MTEIIPAIDIIDGKCVRLTRGDYSRDQTYGDPLDMAISFAGHGLKRVHLVDLDGAREKQVVNFRILEKIASRTSLVIDWGGGLRTREDLKRVFHSGASMVTGGSIAVKDRDEFLGWLTEFGPEKIILGADVRDRKIAVSGWMEETSLEILPFLEEYAGKGVKKVICTDIEHDGMLEGPSKELYREIKRKIPSLYLVASGGVGKMEDIQEMNAMGVDGVIIGKAIYEHRISLKELEKYMINQEV